MDTLFRIIEKAVIVVCLLLAIYFTIVCPCKILINCHKYEFLLLLTIPIIYIIYVHSLQ